MNEQPATATPPNATAGERLCPFCETPNGQTICKKCARDITAPRRRCTQCQRMAPMNEASCPHCGTRPQSDLRWKVPLIIGLFLLAFVLSILLRGL